MARTVGSRTASALRRGLSRAIHELRRCRSVLTKGQERSDHRQPRGSTCRAGTDARTHHGFKNRTIVRPGIGTIGPCRVRECAHPSRRAREPGDRHAITAGHGIGGPLRGATRAPPRCRHRDGVEWERGPERARAECFRFERDRVRYARRRAFTRRVLAGYLGVQPAAVRIRTAVLGKPELDPPCDISFNTSHSDDRSVVAVASNARVGVDVERLRHLDDAITVADAVFTEHEVEFLRSVPATSRSHAFLTLWTRKESVVKAIGAGLAMPLDAFGVLSEGADGAGQPRSDSGPLPFVFAPLDGPPDYVGAVTVDFPTIAVRHMPTEALA